jgi:hypothetical protein
MSKVFDRLGRNGMGVDGLDDKNYEMLVCIDSMWA